MTTDAGAVLDGGAIATFGGHKGGRALRRAVGGALSGGAVVGQEVKRKPGPPFLLRQAGRARRRLRREGRRRLSPSRTRAREFRLPVRPKPRLVLKSTRSVPRTRESIADGGARLVE